MSGSVFNKHVVLDYLWCHSHFYATRLYECEELFRENRGHVAVLALFSCFESICKSVVNDYDSSSFNVKRTEYFNGNRIQLCQYR